jgi:hypothetical protein
MDPVFDLFDMTIDIDALHNHWLLLTSPRKRAGLGIAAPPKPTY